MSEPKPEYNDGRPATQEVMANVFRVPVDDLEAWRDNGWRKAVAQAVMTLAGRGAFSPGDALRVERIDLTANMTTGWEGVAARVVVESGRPS